MTGKTASDTPLLTISDLVIHYEKHLAVEGVSFEAKAGEHVTLLGPSGCGKTTTLRSIAGLEKPTSGEIIVNGQSLFSSRNRVNVPSEDRGVSMVFQSYAIWPHMSVFENVAYGLRVRNAQKADIAAAVNRALELVQMTAFAQRPASLLSGGQQQRVALARAIAFSPKVVLFDEPLSNLDAKLRNAMRVELRDLQLRLQITSIYVTHDQEEALAISDRVIVMHSGRIEQIGSPLDIYDRPRNQFVADFVGSANIIEGRVGQKTSDDVWLFETRTGQSFKCIAPYGIKGDEQHVAIRPAYIEIKPAGTPISSTENHIEGTIRRRMFHGDFIQYIVQWSGGELTVRHAPTELFDEGSNVVLTFTAARCVLLEADERKPN